MKFVRKKNAASGEPADDTPSVSPPPRARKSSPIHTSKPGSGRKSFTLLIGDDGAILVFMQGSTVLRRLFAASPQQDHTETFAELMRSNPKVPISILADVMDQQYVRHTFPPVSPLSIEGLVNRRMERDFNPEDMKSGLRLGRDTAGRKEWQYLIISLTNTPLVQQWISFILELPNPILGIHLLPVEMQRFIPALSKTTNNTKNLPWQFLISNNKVSGFRQVILHEGKLVFTRVSQAVEDAIPAVIAGNLEQEILNTLEYIRRMDFKENDTLEILVIAAQEVVDALDLNRFGAGHSCGFTPLEVANAMRLDQAALSADRFGDVVLSGAFATMRKPVLKFSNSYISKLDTLYKARLGIKVASAVIAGFLLLASGSSIIDAIGSQSAISEAEDKKRAVSTKLMAAKKAIDGLDKDIAYKLLVVSAHDMYVKSATSPDQFVAELAPLLPQDMRVKRLRWGPPGAFPAGAAPATAAPAPVKASPAGASPSTSEIHTDIEVLGAATDAESLTKAAEAFIANLKTALPQYDITAQPFPWISEAKASQVISLEQQTIAAPITADKKLFVLTFTGPKQVASSGAPATPPQPPGTP